MGVLGKRGRCSVILPVMASGGGEVASQYEHVKQQVFRHCAHAVSLRTVFRACLCWI